MTSFWKPYLLLRETDLILGATSLPPICEFFLFIESSFVQHGVGVGSGISEAEAIVAIPSSAGRAGKEH